MVKTRFAPSPSGYLHIGGVRTALYAWLFARNQGGEFLLRIENTHIQRSSQESIDSIMEGLKWLGLDHDGEVIYQKDRFDIYQERANQLIKEGKAYESEGAIRLKSDRTSNIVIKDRVFGDVEVNKDELDDFIIMRSNGAPTYHLAVVIDDHESGITHVMRGDDHLKNTARHIQLMNAFNYPIPQFVHLPMILGSDGSRLSKRHGAMNVLHYRDEGFSSEALLNYLVRLGWSKGDQEIFSIQEMTDGFDLSGINKASAKFDIEKLRWVNQQHLLNTDDSELKMMLEAGSATAKGLNDEVITNFINAYKNRASTINDLISSCDSLFSDEIKYDQAIADKFLKKEILFALKDVVDALQGSRWNQESISEALKSVCEKHQIGFGKIGQPIRIAVTGGTQSPSIDQTLILLDQSIVVDRIEAAIEYIEENSN
jgi:glutamyl-tRNA synthetase